MNSYRSQPTKAELWLEKTKKEIEESKQRKVEFVKQAVLDSVKNNMESFGKDFKFPVTLHWSWPVLLRDQVFKELREEGWKIRQSSKDDGFGDGRADVFEISLS